MKIKDKDFGGKLSSINWNTHIIKSRVVVCANCGGKYLYMNKYKGKCYLQSCKSVHSS